MGGTRKTARQHQHLHLLLGYFLCGDVALDGDAVRTGDPPAAVLAYRCGLHRDAGPAQQIDRRQRLHLLKSICQKYRYHMSQLLLS